jgi:predicted negative regulator of RcsB-dependent stress response
MGRRITRKQLKKDDEFVSAAEIAFAWIADNWRALVAGIAAVCVVALIWWGANLWMGARVDEASLALHRAVQTFEGEVPSPLGVPSGDMEAAAAQFREVIADHGGSDQADMARLYLARIAMSQGQTEDARSTLTEVSERQGDSLIGRLAALDLINMRVAAGQKTEVLGDLEGMITAGSTALPRDVVLYKLGELYYGEGQPDLARGYFDQLEEEFPDSPYLVNVQQRFADLG